jgi:hypothetical protein
MLRGAIEGVTHDAIFGWVYAAEVPLRGRTVLAFLDDRCIGSGKIEIFRQDLKNARLGDGYCGFHFGLTYPGRAEPGRVVVKLEGADAVLLQRGSRIVAG